MGALGAGLGEEAGGARRRASVGARRQAGTRAEARARAGCAGGRQQARAARACGRWLRAGRAGKAVAGARQGATGSGRARQACGLGPGPAAGSALGALDLFLARFDSVFFFSQFLDIVREPGS